MSRGRGSALRFFALVFVLSLPLWLLGHLANQAGAARPYDLPVSSLMAFCPVIAALVLLPRGERLPLLRRSVARFRPGRWYVAAVLLMPGVFAASYVVLRLAGRPLPEPRITWAMVPVLIVMFLVAAVGEEAGWMGYAADRMLARYGAFTVGLVIGLVWAAWHIVPWLQAGRDAGWIAWQCLFTVATRVIIVWMYRNTGASVAAAVLVHASSNVGYALFPVNGSHYDPMTVGLLTAAVAVLVVAVWGPRTLAGRDHGRPPAGPSASSSAG
ncbi:hypothetical protein GCM10010106_18270 [Thermopolyspora flexuosa]|uniref:CAAX prenyl protease 2/Lysostaphin resistance protein A-like domain-containing protein n=1 Tax=Thermopolyspora flexuosa TaxID=103836 RepID=A0A543J420_9ACTN|nr:type II CAAX endopeptidase family protein [Thermopolyspora flexuosa]TQM77586.1 hypothetical protein FHX40_4355 [Thermopolyspora flexuosa]GGM72287.1 hypothetical protein GCM10010106_18270 [Thermopolyspora flexuosa]